MKHILIALLLLLTSLNGIAKEGEVIVTRFYTQAERSILPNKTDQFQVQNITLSTGDEVKTIVDAINKMAKTINDEDFEHYVFSLFVYPQENGAYSIMIESHDPMNDPKQLRENMLGVAKIGYRYFIVQKMPALEALQKSLFTKAKGKTKFIREFELTQYPRKETRTCIDADIKNSDLLIRECEISGVNKLENPQQNTTNE